jgi:sugar (pentulose or hexulose) kinase
MNAYVGIDVGTTNTKVSVVTRNGIDDMDSIERP